MGFRLALMLFAILILMTMFVAGFCFSQPDQPVPEPVSGMSSDSRVIFTLSRSAWPNR